MPMIAAIAENEKCREVLGLTIGNQSILVSISQNDVGHLMRFIQCSILYGYITDVHKNRTPFIKRRTERIEVQLSKE